MARKSSPARSNSYKLSSQLELMNWPFITAQISSNNTFNSPPKQVEFPNYFSMKRVSGATVHALCVSHKWPDKQQINKTNISVVDSISGLIDYLSGKRRRLAGQDGLENWSVEKRIWFGQSGNVTTQVSQVSHSFLRAPRFAFTHSFQPASQSSSN